MTERNLEVPIGLNPEEVAHLDLHQQNLLRFFREHSSFYKTLRAAQVRASRRRQLISEEANKVLRERGRELSAYVTVGATDRILRKPISAAGLSNAIDLLPDPKARKLVGKMVADQVDFIRVLEAQGRFKTARWQLICTWGLYAWYGLLHMVAGVVKAARGRRTG